MKFLIEERHTQPSCWCTQNWLMLASKRTCNNYEWWDKCADRRYNFPFGNVQILLASKRTCLCVCWVEGWVQGRGDAIKASWGIPGTASLPALIYDVVLSCLWLFLYQVPVSISACYCIIIFLILVRLHHMIMLDG